jgi:hypothetical protein
MRIAVFNPETHRIVPIEPTKKMLESDISAFDASGDSRYAMRQVIMIAPEYPTVSLEALMSSIPKQAL